MNDSAGSVRSVVAERDLPYPPEKVWRALTQPHLIKEWLMDSDFALVVGHRFAFRAEWGAVDCEVREIEANRVLSYTWVAMGLESIVTWTLASTDIGTHLRMEQSGFRTDQEQAFQGATHGWKHFLARLDQALSAADG